MPAQFTRGFTFTPIDNVTNTELNDLVDNGSLRPGAITEQDLQSANLSTADVVLFNDVSAGSPGIGALTKLQLAKLWAEPFEIGQTNKVTANFALVSAPVAQFTSASIANLTGASAITGPAPSIAKAWVNFKGDISALTAVSFTFVGTTITATKTAHGLVQGDSITMSGGTGNNTVLNGTWVVSNVPNANSFEFVITSTPAGALSAMTVSPVGILSSFNVRSVAYISAGNYGVNFTTPFANASYTAVVSGQQTNSASANNSVAIHPTTAPTVGTLTLMSKNSTGTEIANSRVNVAVFA